MQWIITLSLVSLAAIFVIWSLLRPLLSRNKAGCSSGCGGCTTASAPPIAGRLALPLIQVTNKIEA